MNWPVLLSVLSLAFTVTTALVAALLADIRNRLIRIEEMVGNGKPGVLVRREEMKLYVQEQLQELRDH